MTAALESKIKDEARRLGFTLVGITTAEPPPHYPAYEHWLEMGRQASMDYLSSEPARAKRADLRLILPGCQSIIVLGLPYSNPGQIADKNDHDRPHGRVAAYAWGTDYHLVMPPKLETLVKFIESQTGQSINNRWYTDTGPLLERDLAMRAGLGWIGKNTCLINPKRGSYFLLAEILLAYPLQPDIPETDHCGTCTRCIDACPTGCILSDRTVDARRCISYLTIENRDAIPEELRPSLGNWVFGCDICQMVCPWNKRFAASEGDPAFAPRDVVPLLELEAELSCSPDDFNRKFKNSPVKRAKHKGYRRNVAVALGNTGDESTQTALGKASQDTDPLIAEHALWAQRIIQRQR